MVSLSPKNLVVLCLSTLFPMLDENYIGNAGAKLLIKVDLPRLQRLLICNFLLI